MSATGLDQSAPLPTCPLTNIGTSANTTLPASASRLFIQIELPAKMGLASAVSQISHGSSVYLQPVFEKVEIKTEYLPTGARKLQVIQNNMLRMK